LLELGNMTGIVTFPSFHAAASIIYLWALWPIWWLRPVSLFVNGLLLLSTPIHGGHYFIDVFAGIAMVFICIWIVRRLPKLQFGEWISTGSSRSAPTAQLSLIPGGGLKFPNEQAPADQPPSKY
jgi:PAP2 superfamily